VNCDDGLNCTTDCCDIVTGCGHYPSAQPCNVQDFNDTYGCPGSNATVKGKVCNQGSCEKRFNWSFREIGGLTQLTFTSPASGTILLPGHQCGEVSLNVSIDQNANGGDFSSLELKGVSTPDEERPPECQLWRGTVAGDPVPCTETAQVRVIRPEITTPNGDPTTSAGANVTNERTYDSGASPAVTVPCAASSVPDPDKLRWTIDNVGAMQATWNPSVPGDPHSGKGLNPTATFTGMPPNYSDFGPKTITLAVDGLSGCQDTQVVEIYYSGTATNHPAGDPAHPNWFYYYQQNEGGSAYTYGCRNGTSWSTSGDPASVHICDNAYTGGEYITTTVTGGQLQATGWSGTNRYYAHFLGVLAHERQHANNQINTGPPEDRDSDRLANAFETGTSQTDPDNNCSAAGALVCPPFFDREVYAGGPVEQAGIAAANTSQDWADPGSNHR